MTSYPASSPSGLSSYEEEVEQAALAWLEELGWPVLPGDYLAPDGPTVARSDYRDYGASLPDAPIREGRAMALLPHLVFPGVPEAIRRI